jgi:hypothetical protein
MSPPDVQDLTALSHSERLQRIQTDAPELVRLLDEFRSSLKEVQNVLLPAVEKFVA